MYNKTLIRNNGNFNYLYHIWLTDEAFLVLNSEVCRLKVLNIGKGVILNSFGLYTCRFI